MSDRGQNSAYQPRDHRRGPSRKRGPAAVLGCSLLVMLRYGLRARNGLTFDLKWRVRADRVQVSDAGLMNAMPFVGVSVAFVAIAVYDIATGSQSPVYNGQRAMIAPAFFSVAAVSILLGFIVWTARRVVSVVEDRVIVDDYLLFVARRFIEAPIDEFYLVRQPIMYLGGGAWTPKRTGVVLWHEDDPLHGGEPIMVLHSSKSFEKRATYWDAIPVPIREERRASAVAVFTGLRSML